MHLGGAIDADAADKAARFMQLCDAHALPLVSLIDTPGFMVGPEIESRGQVRHVSRMFVVGAQLRVPVAAIVLRKAYGLGAMAMAAGGMHAPMATVAWPSGEFGAMGLEGAVELGYRKELAAAREGEEREALRERLVAAQYEKGKAIHMAATLEIDAVIDPADSRRWLAVDARIGAPARAGRAASSTRGRRVGPVVRLQRGVGGLVAERDLVAGVVGPSAAPAPERVPARHQRFTSATHSSSFAMIFPCARVRRRSDCLPLIAAPAIGGDFDLR